MTECKVKIKGIIMPVIWIDFIAEEVCTGKIRDVGTIYSTDQIEKVILFDTKNTRFGTKEA